jgi:hypothetical protein
MLVTVEHRYVPAASAQLGDDRAAERPGATCD